MGASITLAGESLIAQKQGLGTTLEIARFVLAHIPGLDTTLPVDRSAGRPAAEQIVHIADITQRGYLAPNQVVYSLQLDSSIGDFDFNWIGLETVEDVIVVLAYVPLQMKRREIPPMQTGNNLTRNLVIQFDGAQALTGTSVPASTWQYDASPRLIALEAAVDERVRLSGDTMTGPLVLAAAPTEAMHAAPRSFVEQHVENYVAESLTSALDNHLAALHASALSFS
ncbi:phage tail protein [Stutzerimonas zhaodongensis]|uniref:phage tail-collar fiber domain-containing protein n=1 Tax=Stutzerimonas zhaodongensis TaxID=1176257 RepID=UPI0039B98B47